MRQNDEQFRRGSGSDDESVYCSCLSWGSERERVGGVERALVCIYSSDASRYLHCFSDE